MYGFTYCKNLLKEKVDVVIVGVTSRGTLLALSTSRRIETWLLSRSIIRKLNFKVLGGYLKFSYCVEVRARRS